jgi:undecaprenyl diphosphate synthase
MPGTDDTATDSALVPQHVAVIMDGNGRWARRRGMPRHFGHRSGVRAVRATVRHCAEAGVAHLTLFAFSSENWSRPADEVTGLMRLFLDALQKEVAELDENDVRLMFIGDLSRLSARLRNEMAQAERITAGNTGLQLRVAVGYGGRWDIVMAARALAELARDGKLDPATIDEASIQAHLQLQDCPDPDLMIRTGGERRISNFLLWNLAYAELYFCDALWPDFDRDELQAALAFYQSRQRRFGRVAEAAAGGGRA